MEKICEFCMVLPPVVYCKADAARLCLSCDAKVHSANSLSHRHPRTLLCESCKYRPAYIQCHNHQIFMCHSCDSDNHRNSSEHKRKATVSYVGCPSADDLAALWGFDLNELENVSLDQEQFVFTSNVVLDDSCSLDLKDMKSCCLQDGEYSNLSISEVGSASQRTKDKEGYSQKQNSCLILQQILHLKKLQLSEGNEISCLKQGKLHFNGDSFVHDKILKPHKNIEIDLRPSLDQYTDLQDRSQGGVTNDLISSPFSQLDNSTNVESSLHAESFLECASPSPSHEVLELWPQSMQDLGVCDEQGCIGDFDMPDVDLSFRNFEDLFRAEQDAIRPMNAPEISSLSIMQLDDIDHVKTYNSYHCSIMPTCSNSSFSASRITAESSGSEHKDEGLSPTVARQNLTCDLSGSGNSHLYRKERYKAKKKVGRCDKRTQQTSQRAKSDSKRKGKAKLVRAEGGYDSDSVNLNQSF